MTVRSSSTRPAAVAGAFYPLDAADLGRRVSGLLAGAPAPHAARRRPPKALIAPHAGYIYSGALAARAYRLLEPHRTSIRRVVLIGPSHRVAFDGVALPSAQAFRTPLGDVGLDRAAAAACPPGAIRVADEPHALEHSIEVQLPFLQTVLERFEIVPLVVGRASPREVAEVLDALWGDPHTLIVASSDLSHGHAYALAARVDRASVDSMLRLEPRLDHDQACGATAINALVTCARRRGLSPTLLGLCNSGDTAGPRERVVGYCALALDACGDDDGHAAG